MFPTKGQVTHALLTRPPLSSSIFTPKGSNKRTPFDLHVLGMPPAFVLSQDQTLHKIYFRVFSSFTYLLALFPFPKKLFELSESALSVSSDSVFSIIWFVRFIQLFNFQRACAVSRQLLYIITSPFPCQHLFSNFFQILSFCVGRSLTTCISYHFLFPLSTTIFVFYPLTKLIHFIPQN